MRVLVTGGAGYVGSHAARELARQRHDLLVYDNLCTGHRFLADGFDFVEGDIGDRQRLAAALRGVDAVLHFAAHADLGESVRNPSKYFENNVRAGLCLLNTVLEAGVRYFVFSSTCAVYGVPSKIPITEDAARQPVSPYGASKLFFEHALEAYASAYCLRYVSLRYFNAAGADESGEIGEYHHPETHLIPTALQVAAGQRGEMEIFGSDYPTPDGTCVRDYVHVNDLAAAHVLALQHLAGQGQAVALNLGTGSGHSILQVLSTVEEVTGRILPKRFGPRRPGDPAVLVADPGLARQLLGWRPARSLRDIVSSAWKWAQRLHQRRP